MSADEPGKAALNKQIQIPEWENAAVNKNSEGLGVSARPRKPFKATFSSKLDSILPPYRRYAGLSRNVFLWVLLALLALIIGLAVGLTEHSKYVYWIIPAGR